MFILYVYLWSTTCFAGPLATPNDAASSCRGPQHVRSLDVTQIRGAAECEAVARYTYQLAPLSTSAFCVSQKDLTDSAK